ncbi:FixH family protein [Ignatzschineria sp. LJL83]
MNETVAIMLLGVACVLVACLVLNKVFRFTALQAASITALMGIAVVVPFSIVRWRGGDVFTLYITCNLMTSFAYYLLGSGGMKNLRGKDGKRMHWVPITVLGFFLVLTIQNGAFIVMAEKGLMFKSNEEDSFVSTRFPGEVPNAYHKKEAYYNAYQQRLLEQEKRGWQVTFGFTAEPFVNEDNFFKVQILDKDNNPLDSAEVVAKFTRSAEQELNRTYALEMLEPGIYSVSTNFERIGPWGLELDIVRGDDTHELVGRTLINCPPDMECDLQRKLRVR